MRDVQTPDWSREAPRTFWDPCRKLLKSVRTYQRWGGTSPIARIVRVISVVRHRFWSAVTGADIPLNSNIGGGLMIPHPNGIVIHPSAVIGPNCFILQQVTLGTGAAGGTPTIGAGVLIGAGAKILGPVFIGDEAKIGANAVVLGDVPARTSAVGIPAKILRPSTKPSTQSDACGR